MCKDILRLEVERILARGVLGKDIFQEVEDERTDQYYQWVDFLSEGYTARTICH